MTTPPPAWLLSCAGIALTLLFGAWKLAVSPVLERRAHTSSPSQSL